MVQNIETGTPAVSAADITDTNLPSSQDQTLYVYQAGQPIAIYNGAEGADLLNGAVSSIVSGTTTSYNPEAGLRWQWTDTATLSRTVDQSDFPDDSLTSKSPTLPDGWISPWSWQTSGTNSATPNWTLSAGSIVQNTQQENVAFAETITGTTGQSLPGIPVQGSNPGDEPNYTNRID